MPNRDYSKNWLLDAFMRGGVDIALLQDAHPDAIVDVLKSPDSASSEDINLLLNSCSVLSNNENFGLDMITLVDIPATGTFVYLLESADTVEQLCELIQRYYPIFHYQGATMEYHNNGETLTLRYCINNDTDTCTRHDNEWTMGFFASFLQRKTPQSSRPLKATFSNSAPKNLSKLHHYLGKNLHFDQKYTEIIYPALMSQVKLSHSDIVLLAILRNHAEELLEQVIKTNSFRNNVRLLINNDIEKGNLKANSIAKQLAVSLSGMKRKLSAENTSFTQLKKEVALELSQKLLIHSDTPIREISNRLGYTDPSAFCRMFSTAHGISPTQYRAVKR